MEPDQLVSTRRINRVITNRKIPNPYSLVLGWNQWISGRKNSLVRLKDIAILGEVILRAEPAPSIGGKRGALSVNRTHTSSSENKCHVLGRLCVATGLGRPTFPCDPQPARSWAATQTPLDSYTRSERG